MEFLNKHINADEIVMDADTGLPVKAIYFSSDCTGNPRKQPAVFWFDIMDEPESGFGA